jgi:hypothetical protein
MNTETNSTHPLLHIFSIRDFFLLWSGSTISMLGSQFTMIALPWQADCCCLRHFGPRCILRSDH